MPIVLHLEWWYEGRWCRIGWDADTDRSKTDLREHGRKLALAGGWYRLTHESHYRDAPPVVVYDYPFVKPYTKEAS